MSELCGPATRKHYIFVRPKINTVYKGDNSLRIYRPTVWDDILPEKLKECST